MTKKWNIELDDIALEDQELGCKLDRKWREGKMCMDQRTYKHHMFSKVSHNMSLYNRGGKDAFSEGTTQAIKRKILAQTLQRVPDGEITTQYDKNTIEQAEIEYIFKHKVLTSEIDGDDMHKNLVRTFKESYDYGFACVRTGFERDLDGDPRISFKLIPYSDVIPAPDCDFIEEAEWYIIREYMSRSALEALLDDEGNVADTTYVKEVVQYLVENDIKDASSSPESIKLQDEKQGVTPTQSVEIRTYYCKGDDEFITYVPRINAVLRRVKNYDPRKGVPLHFMILEPDPDFPLGCSSVMWTLAQQQFADAFQSVAYETLLLSMHPPLMTFGNLVNPKIKMKPNAIWPMGTNQNNKIEPFRVETTTLTQYGSILENISGRMMQSMNITDATVASDANVAQYSATPQGVEQQKLDKTITINQLQKRVEIFFQEWANHALRSYINSMHGEQVLTVDEKTRRKIWDIERSMHANPQDPMQVEPYDSIIDGDKITIDFDELSADMLSFEVRVGSLIENEKETERRNIQEMLIPVSQMMGNVGDQNRAAFEKVLMQLIQRLCELSDIDISQSLSDQINTQILAQAMQATMEAVAGQQQQINQMQQQMGAPGVPEEGVPQGQPPMGMQPEGMPVPNAEPGMVEEPSAEAPMPEIPGGEPQPEMIE